MSSEVTDGPSTSDSSNSKEKAEAKLKAANLLAQGKRNLICGEVPAAVQLFQEACQTLSGEFGEVANECAEAYFQYGCALLDLARMEGDVLGNALEGEESADGTEEEDEEGEEEGSDENEGDAGGDAEAVSQEEDGVKEGEEDGDDVSNLQLAWEMLELSRVIYNREDSKDTKLKTAEISLKLGEVSLESEQCERAVEELKNCLETRKQLLEPHDRSIAEVHYQLGIARMMANDFSPAIDDFKSAVTCLESKIEQLKEVVKQKPPKEASDLIEPAERAEKEIKDIELLIPDIKNKITDAEDEFKTKESLKSSIKESLMSAFGDSSTETGFGSSSKSESPVTEEKKASNISHLIRKKRKPDDEKTEDVESKKAKQEDGSGDAPVQNGTGDAPVQNGTGDGPIQNGTGDGPIQNDCIESEKAETMEAT